MAEKGLVQVFISLTTLDHDLARKLDPRASAPARRLQCIEALSAAGIPVGVLSSPMIPVITDQGMESVLAAARAAGATRAGYSVLRLPREVNDLFQDWLQRHFPLRAEHVMSQVRQMRDGRDNNSEFGKRMRGEGIFSQLIRDRFRLACRKLGYDLSKRMQIDTSQFHPPEYLAPRKSTPQLDLF
jgi:DNA repair photolyase